MTNQGPRQMAPLFTTLSVPPNCFNSSNLSGMHLITAEDVLRQLNGQGHDGTQLQTLPEIQNVTSKLGYSFTTGFC